MRIKLSFYLHCKYTFKLSPWLNMRSVRSSCWEQGYAMMQFPHFYVKLKPDGLSSGAVIYFNLKNHLLRRCDFYFKNRVSPKY
jgi:hypothetical protein